MKKWMLLSFIWSIISVATHGQTIDNQTFTDIDGNNVLLSSFEGKRIFLFIAPIDSSSIVPLKDLEIFHRLHADSVQIIAILSNEDGYSAGHKEAVKSLYKELNIILTEGMYTRKSAGGNQADLMHWLTNKSLNFRSSLDAQGVGQKFFVNRQGKLNGVLPADVPLLDPVVWHLIYKN